MKEETFRRFMREAYLLGKNDGWEINFEELLKRICAQLYGKNEV